MTVFALMALVPGLAQDPVAFVHQDTGLAWQVPANWKYRKLRNSVEWTFPIKEGVTGRFEAFGMVYSGEIEVWQSGQVALAKQMKREIARQWQEELLSVPLLMSQTTWKERKGDDETPWRSQTGILYSQTPRKLVVRLSAPQEGWDAAEFAFRNLLQTLRTDDGRPIQPFDPTSKPSATEQDALRPQKRTLWRVDTEPAPKFEIPPKSLSLTAGGRKVEFAYPNDWTVDENGADAFEFRRPGLAQPVSVSIFSSLDSPPPGRTLLKNSGESLARFKEVRRREEPTLSRNRSGTVVTYVLREGTNEQGPLYTLDAVGSGESGDYFVIRWSSTDAKSARRDMDKIIDLVRRAHVRLAP